MKFRKYTLGLLFLLVITSIYYILTFNQQPKLYNETKTDKGFTFTISDIQFAKLSPQQGLLIYNICLETSKRDINLYTEGKVTYSEYQSDISFNFDTTLWKSCQERSLIIFPQETFPVKFEIFSIKPAYEEKITGKWEFLITNSDVHFINAPILSKTPSSELIPTNIELKASNLQKLIPPEFTKLDISALSIDVCLSSDKQVNWYIWDANLELNNGETKKRFFGVDEMLFARKIENNCKIISFNVPNNETYTSANLKIFGLSFPRDTYKEESCKKYLNELQKVINNQFSGLLLECIYFPAWSESASWGINYVSKPASMSELDVNLILWNQDLYTQKGNWEFELKVID